MRRSLFINILLALVWVAVTGRLTPLNLVAGFGLGYLLMLLARPLIRVQRYHRRVWYILELAAVFLWDLLLSSLRIGLDVVTPRHRMHSAVIKVPLDLESDAEITLLANLISLTPGMLTLDHAEDRRSLFIHVMHVKGRDVEATRARIKRKLERRVRRAVTGNE